jgi:hypothetical protein
MFQCVVAQQSTYNVNITPPWLNEPGNTGYKTYANLMAMYVLLQQWNERQTNNSKRDTYIDIYIYTKYSIVS